MSAGVRNVRVELGPRSYEIEIGRGILDRAGRLCAETCGASHVVIITDRHVLKPHVHRLSEVLSAACDRIDVLVVEPGEKTKNPDIAWSLWDQMLEIRADRKSLVLAAGGGVIGDLAGFVAATFARGLKYVQVPTTLLAQVDSSVGGKVGVNLEGAKNMVGAFWQPSGVLIDLAALDTLPVREYRSGLAEVVKYGVILDPEFFAYLEQHVAGLNSRDDAVLRHAIARSCELKAQIVSQDEREETGQRAVLNYGHTFCHAFETLTGYGALLHGEAVAIGMLCASRLAETLGRIPAELTRRQEALLRALGLPVEAPPLDGEEVLQVMLRDKKVEHGKLRFVLPTRLGHVELVGGVDPAAVRAALLR